MEKKSVKILTRIFCIASVVAVLFLCACPAFALGEDYGANRYSAMPFDYLVVSGYGGQIDYMGRFSRVGTRLTSYIKGFDGGREVIASVYCDNSNLQSDYTFEFVPAYGATITNSVTLNAENTFMQLLTDGLIVQIGSTLYEGDSIPEWFTVTNVRVEGVVAGFEGEDGVLISVDYPFTLDFNVSYSNMEQIELASLIKIALRTHEVPPITEEHGYLFERLSVRFYIRKNLDFNDFAVKITNTPNGVYTEPLSTQTWVRKYINNKVDIGTPPAPPASNELDVATFLGDSVSAFMDVEIFPGFTLGTLFGIALTIGVLFFGLKMLV